MILRAVSVWYVYRRWCVIIERVLQTGPYGPKDLNHNSKVSLDALTPEHLSLVRQVEKVLFSYVIHSKMAVPKTKYEEAYKMMLTLKDVTRYKGAFGDGVIHESCVSRDLQN